MPTEAFYTQFGLMGGFFAAIVGLIVAYFHYRINRATKEFDAKTARDQEEHKAKLQQALMELEAKIRAEEDERKHRFDETQTNVDRKVKVRDRLSQTEAGQIALLNADYEHMKVQYQNQGELLMQYQNSNTALEARVEELEIDANDAFHLKEINKLLKDQNDEQAKKISELTARDSTSESLVRQLNTKYNRDTAALRSEINVLQLTIAELEKSSQREK